MFDESPKPSKEEVDDARQAVRLSMFSYLGVFIPLIGVVLASYALSLTKHLRHFDGQLGRKVALARRNSWIAVSLSLLIVLGWSTAYYFYNQQTLATQRRLLREECLSNVEIAREVETNQPVQMDEAGYFKIVDVSKYSTAANNCRSQYPE